MTFNEPNVENPLPTPTTARPGSEAKLALMCQRYAEGKYLFHADDPSLIPSRDSDYPGTPGERKYDRGEREPEWYEDVGCDIIHGCLENVNGIGV